MPSTAQNGSKEHASDLVQPVVGRFAPTPSGYLHVGNVFSFLVAYLYVRQREGTMLMRVEDLDKPRCKQRFIDAMFEDLAWLGFEWDQEPIYQSKRYDLYEDALRILEHQGLLYPCFCSRADLHAASAPHPGEEVRYKGTCRNLTEAQRKERAQHKDPCARIIVTDQPLKFTDLFQGPQTGSLSQISGDFVVKRSDGIPSYQLAVVVDDHLQGVNSVIRGCDLLQSTFKQVHLKRCLGMHDEVVYGHVPLFMDASGHRLAKRAGDTSIKAMRESGTLHADEILGRIAYQAGLVDEERSYNMGELVNHANLATLVGQRAILFDGAAR